MTKKQKQIYIKRLKSFAWRTSMMVIALYVDFFASNLGLLELPAEATVLLGLILGEISKYLNSKK